MKKAYLDLFDRNINVAKVINPETRAIQSAWDKGVTAAQVANDLNKSERLRLKRAAQFAKMNVHIVKPFGSR